MAAHARLKNVFMEDEKCNLMSWLNIYYIFGEQGQVLLWKSLCKKPA